MSPPRLSHLRHRAVLGLMVVVISAAAAWGLRPAPKAELSLEQTYDWLRTCRRTGDYGAMRPYIHPSAREGIIDLLVAVDELMLAHSAALAAMRQACPEMDTQPYDRVFAGVIQDALGLFSREVDLVSTRQDGDTAVVTVQVAHKTPLLRLQFERSESVWQYVLGPEDPEAIREVRKRTRSLRQIELVLAKDHLTPGQIYRECQIRLGSTRVQRSRDPD